MREELKESIRLRDFTGKFRDFPYERPDLEEIRSEMEHCIESIERAENYEEARAAFMDYQALDEWVFTLATCVFVRRMADTRESFYAGEMNFFDNGNASLIPVKTRYAKVILTSPYRSRFEEEFGPMLTVRMEGFLKIHNDKVMDDWAEYNCIHSEYQGISGSCYTEFQGRKTNFYGLMKGMEHPDRKIRKEAFEKWSGLYEKISPQLEELYIRMIHVLNGLARKLGYESYEPVSYMELNRYDYTSKEMAEFRRQIREVVVPIGCKLRERQRKELGLETLTFYDEPLFYKDGNPAPAGTVSEQLEHIRQAFHKVHPQAGAFYDLVCEHELYDLESRVGKALGGYCRWLPTFRAPMIFSNLNHTIGDAEVLTHEGGHGFAAYTYTRYGKNPIDALRFAPGETHEVQSMTMEYLTAGYLDDFFGGKEEGDKYRYMHIAQSVLNLCFQCAVDEFQVEAFKAENELDSKKLRAIWKQMEEKYMPWRNYDGNAFLEEGGLWMHKPHLWQLPFMYLQYGLAEIGALEYYGRSKTDPQGVWDDYYRFCHMGCTQHYTDLLKIGGLHLPYEEGNVARVIEGIREDLRV